MPPGSMTQASSRGQYLPQLEAFVADNGCYGMCKKCASMQRVRARPGRNGRVRAKPVLGRVVMARPAVSGAGAGVSTRVLRVGVPCGE